MRGVGEQRHLWVPFFFSRSILRACLETANLLSGVPRSVIGSSENISVGNQLFLLVKFPIPLGRPVFGLVIWLLSAVLFSSLG